MSENKKYATNYGSKGFGHLMVVFSPLMLPSFFFFFLLKISSTYLNFAVIFSTGGPAKILKPADLHKLGPECFKQVCIKQYC